MFDLEFEFDAKEYMKISNTGIAFSVVVCLILLSVLGSDIIDIYCKMIACGIALFHVGISVVKAMVTRNHAKYYKKKLVVHTLYSSMIENILLITFIGYYGLDIFSFVLCAINVFLITIKSRAVEKINKEGLSGEGEDEAEIIQTDNEKKE